VAGLPDGTVSSVCRSCLKDLGGWLPATASRGARAFFADTPPIETDSVHVSPAEGGRAGHFGRHELVRAGPLADLRAPRVRPTRSPWDTQRISGGSSGGAAASVGARMLPMAHASDGFRLIRAPSGVAAGWSA